MYLSKQTKLRKYFSWDYREQEKKEWNIIFSCVMENLLHELITNKNTMNKMESTDSKFYNVLFTETTTKSSSEKWFED